MGSPGRMTRSDAVFAVVCVFFVLATVFVAMRMVSRLVIVKRVDWDDFLMAIAWVSGSSSGLMERY